MAALPRAGTGEATEPQSKDELPAHKRRYIAPTGNESLTSARRAVIDVSAQVGKTQLVPAGAGVGKRGRGAGFYCEACDLTFKDNIQWVEHLNTIQHLINTGETAQVKRATVEEVCARVDYWVQKLEEEKSALVTSIDERLKVREKEREKEAEERRERKKQERVAKASLKEEEEKAKRGYGEGFRIEGEHEEDDMMEAMGFTGFGSSRK